MNRILLVMAATLALSGQDKASKFTGFITDSMCAYSSHSRMKMGPTDAACTIACHQAHDADYVLLDGQQVYALSDQKTPEKFAGQKVTVTGTLDAKSKTIKVASIVPAK